MSAVFDEDIHGWEGEIISSVVTQFEDVDGKGHGPRIEPTSMLVSNRLVRFTMQFSDLHSF